MKRFIWFTILMARKSKQHGAGTLGEPVADSQHGGEVGGNRPREEGTRVWARKQERLRRVASLLAWDSCDHEEAHLQEKGQPL